MVYKIKVPVLKADFPFQYLQIYFKRPVKRIKLKYLHLNILQQLLQSIIQIEFFSIKLVNVTFTNIVTVAINKIQLR